jgi:DegV family protein with EDD domain
MRRVTVVTDTSACLPIEVTAKYGIEVVPMELIYEGKVYRDEIDINAEQFYDILAKAKHLPTTSAPSPQQYVEIYRKLAENKGDILVITASTRFSHVFESASIAAEMYRDNFGNARIEVIDCMTAAGSQGLIVLEAARSAFAGASLLEVLKVVEELMNKVYLIAFLDTLYYLAKGGRVPQVVAWGNSLLSIKPIFELVPGEARAKTIGLVRTRHRAIERVKGLLGERLDGHFLHAIVMHSNALREAEELRDFLCSNFKCEEVYIKDFTPVMGVHTGPGLLAVSFLTAN